MAERPVFSALEARDILAADGLRAELVGDGQARYATAVIDSRKAGPGSLFVALRGARADGHDFAKAALGAGSRVVLVDREGWKPREAALRDLVVGSGTAVLVVDAALPAFQALAKAKRRRHPELVRVGVTGSSGKTTTKEILASILSQSGAVAMNQGNLNSDQGLALSLFGIEGGERWGVFEMGMNRAGEMGELAAMYEPDYALITNIGTAHIGILGSRQAIAEEKKQVFSRFDGRQVGFVGEDDDFNAFLKEGVRGEVVDWGRGSTAAFRGAEDRGLDGWEIHLAVDWEGLRINYPLVGRHNLENALAAIAVAARMGIRAADVKAGLESVRPPFGRSEILRGRVTVVSDCYNANPESALAAIEFCDSLAWAGRKLYVLGSMLELGEDTEAAHRRMGEAAARSQAAALFFFGEETRVAAEAAREAGFGGKLLHEEDAARLGEAVASWLREGDLVLLKASRGMALERILESIPGEREGEACSCR